MSTRALVVLVALLAVAIGGLFWPGRHAAPQAVPAAAPLLPAFTEDALRGIAVDCSGKAFSLERVTSGTWRVTGPEAGEADPRRVNELVAALQDARVRKVIAETGMNAKAYGLAPAACTVRVGMVAGAPPPALRLGRSSPVGTERYAECGDARVVLTDGSLYTVAARDAETYRERRLIPVEAEAITRIALDRPAGRLVLAKDDRGWRLEAPQPSAASSAACSDLARAIASIEFARSATTGAPGTVRPERRLRLEISTRDGAPPRVGFVATAGIDGKRLAWREDAATAGLVEESAARELERPADAFRETTVAAPMAGS